MYTYAFARDKNTWTCSRARPPNLVGVKRVTIMLGTGSLETSNMVRDAKNMPFTVHLLAISDIHSHHGLFTSIMAVFFYIFIFFSTFSEGTKWGRNTHRW